MEKAKKPIYKNWWFWVIVAIAIVLIGSAAGGDKSNAPSAQASDPPTQTDVPASTEKPTREPTEEPTEPPTETPTETPTEIPTEIPTETPTEPPTETPTEVPTEVPTEKPAAGQTSSNSLESVAQLVEANLEENFDYYKVETTEDALIVNVWGDGIAADVLTLQTTGDFDNENWVKLKESFVSMAGSIRDLMDVGECKDAYLQLNLLNDMNTDYVLLTIYNTTVFYDILAE